MLKVLFLEDDPQLIDRIAFVLESIKNVEVTRAIDRHQALTLLKNNPGEFKLIVIDHHLPSLSSLDDLQKAAMGIECIFCIESLKNPPITAGWKVLATVERSFAARLLHVHVEAWAKAQTENQDAEGTEILTEESPNDFVRIKTKLLIDISPLLCDIYARLSEKKTIKIFREGDVFDANDLSRYALQKKIEYMYLAADKCGEFIHKYIQFIEQHIRENKTMSMDEISFMNGSIHETVQELTDKLGFNRDVQALAKSQVALTLKTMGKKPNLKAILDQLESNRGQYSADHCFMTGYVACAIASNLDWGSDTTFHKLTLAAFMHDLTLTDERIVDCETVEEVKERGLPNELVEMFRRHPAKASDMIRAMTEVPADVDSIVGQHHELPDGSGFPRGITARNITPLASVFILAHAITHEVLKNPKEFKLAAFMETLSERFPQSHFRKAITASAALIF